MSTVPLIHFLLVFNVRDQELVSHEQFDDAELAMARYSEVEQEYRDNRGIEVVLVGSDSLDTIRQTHGNYFRSVDGRLAELVGS